MLRTPKQDESVVIYETRKNRISGAHTQVIDLRPQGEKYALHCVTHDHTQARDVRLAAEAESHKSQEWCASCKAVVEAKSMPQDVRGWTVETILDAIGNARSEKTCVAKIDALLA